jgi:hypothetical protein
MGQYHKIVNLSRNEYLDPPCFDDGDKLMEFGNSRNGTLMALAVLLSNSPNQGGGDLRSDDTEWYGRWAGDSIVIAGDYAGPGDKGEPEEGDNLWDQAKYKFRNISYEIIRVIRTAGEEIRCNRTFP